MQNDKNEDYAVSFWAKVAMWIQLRKMIKTTKRSIRHAKLTMKMYQHLAQLTDPVEEKKKHSDLMLKYGQVEASAMAEERALRIFQSFDLNDVELYKPVSE